MNFDARVELRNGIVLCWYDVIQHIKYNENKCNDLILIKDSCKPFVKTDTLGKANENPTDGRIETVKRRVINFIFI